MVSHINVDAALNQLMSFVCLQLTVRYVNSLMLIFSVLNIQEHICPRLIVMFFAQFLCIWETGTKQLHSIIW